MGYPSIFPTGTLIYDKDKTFNGYTVFPSAKGALLIDMNGNEVNLWAGLGGFPNKILPGGYVMGTTGERGGKYAYQDQLDLVIFLREPIAPNRMDPDGRGIIRMCDAHNIPVATNLATAELLIKALERGDLEWREMYK